MTQTSASTTISVAAPIEPTITFSTFSTPPPSTSATARPAPSAKGSLRLVK